MSRIVSRLKQAPKQKRRSKAVPVLGAAGLSLTLANGASAATVGPAPDTQIRDAGASHAITLREEEISDVSLATFYVFDKENAGTLRPGVQLAMAAGACGGCGCSGCGCWTGNYYTSQVFGNDAYPPPPPRPFRHVRRHVQKRP